MTRYGTAKVPCVEGKEEMELDNRDSMAGTAKDAQEMDRLGKKQQLNVILSSMSR